MESIVKDGNYQIRMNEDYGEVVVYRRESCKVTVTEWSEGVVRRATVPDYAVGLGQLSRYPILRANYGKAGRYNVDPSAGMARWNGSVSGKALAKALRGFGLESRETLKLMSRLRKYGPHSYVIRCG